MQLCFGLALLLAVLVMGEAMPTNKVHGCCTEVSIKNITAPILGYRIQRKMPPCVNAVIFTTTEGEVCSHFQQDWVFTKIREIEQARRAKKTATSATSTSTTSTKSASSTVSTTSASSTQSTASTSSPLKALLRRK